MALIALSYRDLLCCVVLLLKLGLVLFWLGITQPQDFIGSSLILSNMLLIDRLATRWTLGWTPTPCCASCLLGASCRFFLYYYCASCAV